ncbi:MAG: 2-hydroxyacyl-CoA dehydratase subunit D [Promethearchaeota archaeon]
MEYGWFDSGCYTPEELIMAAGFTPRRVLGTPGTPTTAADEWVQQTHCFLARAALDAAIRGEFEGLAGVVMTHGCDVTSREYDLWHAHAKVRALHYLNVPLKTDAVAERFYLKELRRFKQHLEELSGRPVESDAIDGAIDLLNEMRATLRAIDELRARDPPKVRASELFHLVKAAQFEDKATVVPRLRRSLEEFEARADAGAPDGARVLLTGTLVDTPELFEMIEAAGMEVVADDLDVGRDYYSFSVEKTGRPLKDLAHGYLSKTPNATKHPPDGRLEALVKLARERNVRGVIYEAVKFCEPYLYDSVFVTNYFKENEGLPVLFVEREYGPQGLSQLRTRLEAFKEVL